VARTTTKLDRAWRWVLKLTGWGTFVVGGVAVPLIRYGRLDFGTLAAGMILALGGSAEQMLEFLSRRVPQPSIEDESPK
jgi:hypothetical protein